MRLGSLARLICLWIFFFGMSSAHAKDRIVEKAYFEDASGLIRFQQLTKEDFHPYSGILGRGYTHSAYWVRLHIQPIPSDESLILRILPNFLDEVILFDPVYGSLGESVRGDEQPTQDRYKSLNLNFTIPSGAAPRDVWLRVRTQSTFLLAPEVLGYEETERADLLQEIKSDFYLFIVGVFIVWGIANTWGRQDSLIGFFTLKEVLNLVMMLGFLGYTGLLWPENWTIRPGLLSDLSVAPSVASSFYFDYRVLRTYSPNRYLLRLLFLLPWSYLVYVYLMFRGSALDAFYLNMLLVIFEPALTFCLTLTIPREKEGGEASQLLSPKTIRWMYGLILVGLSFSSLPSIGIIDAGNFVFDGFLMHSLMSGLAIMVMLHLRIRRREEQRIALTLRHHEMQARFEADHQRLEEQSQFLAMLMHELRTPLSVVRMILGSRYQTPKTLATAENSIEEMAAILDRCLKTDQLETGLLKPHLGAVNPIDLVRETAGNSGYEGRIKIGPCEDLNLRSDPLLLRLVLANLMDNAHKYGKSNTPIIVSFLVEQDQIFIRVENQPGEVGRPHPERLFQKYYRDARAQSLTGTGLGLYMAKRISQHLGGELSYTPTDRTIGFTLCLPR